MDQLGNYADSRLLSGCTYCGGSEATRDHVPSRVFLDQPYPENLPVVPACWECNNSLSKDEEYVACLIEAAIAGVADPEKVKRLRVAEILRRSPALQAQLTAAREEVAGRVQFNPDVARVERVVLKLARGHAAFELSQLVREPPGALLCVPLIAMDPDQRSEFEQPHFPQAYGEVGSRAMQRIAVVETRLKSPSGEAFDFALLVHDWVEVQAGRYRFLATEDVDGIRVRFVLGEYLACDVKWIEVDT